MRSRGTQPLGRNVLAIFAIGAVVMLGAASWGLARAQHSQRQELRKRFQSRAEIGSALIGSLFDSSAPQQQQQAADRFGSPKIDMRALNRQAAAGGSRFVAILDDSGDVLGASRGAPADLGALVASDPPWIRRALSTGGYGLSGVSAGVIYTALPFKGALGTRVQISAIDARFLAAFLRGTLAQVSRSTASKSLIVDDRLRVIAERGAKTKVGELIADAPLRSALHDKPSGAYSDRLYASRSIGHTGWRLVLASPQSQVYAPAGGFGRWLPWIILALGAMALVAIGVLLHRTVVASAQVRVANDELERSNKDLERFAYVASHDLSEPLRTIGGFGGLLERRYGSSFDDEGRRMLEHITSGAARLQALIDGLLSYARVSAAEHHAERVDLDALAREVCDSIGPALSEGGAEVQIRPLPVVLGERRQLAQLLQNLILNAVKFTAEDVAPRIALSAGQLSDDRWQIRVADNGVGIEPAQAERIFEMFQRGTTGSGESGTGIGLALCARIVERHGGRIRAVPGEGGGSVFAFDLQAAPGGGMPEPEAPSEEGVLAGERFVR